MRISLTPEKACKVRSACQELVNTVLPSKRLVARVLGLLTSSFPGEMYGPLYYRWIEIAKTQALHQCKSSFDSPMSMSPEAISDLRLWIESIDTAFNQSVIFFHKLPWLQTPKKRDGGAHLRVLPHAGLGLHTNAKNYINYLETKAVFLGLTISDTISGNQSLSLPDNSTAEACLNQMGTCHSSTINKLVIDIWEWCITHNIWINASHIPSIHNSAADSESRQTRKENEWSLNYTVFQKAIDEAHVQPDVDLFASRLNYKCKRYVSYQPDPGSYAVNAK